jgi:hypothetical protein
MMPRACAAPMLAKAVRLIPTFCSRSGWRLSRLGVRWAVHGPGIAIDVRTMLHQLRFIWIYCATINVGLCEGRLKDQACRKGQVGWFHLVTDPWLGGGFFLWVALAQEAFMSMFFLLCS